MDFLDLKAKYEKDKDESNRGYDLRIYRKVLEGTIYDVLNYSFYNNFTDSSEPIPMSKRRPSVRCLIAKIVVDDSVSLLFGEGRFPVVKCESEKDQEIVNDFLADSQLNLAMIDLATSGSVGTGAMIYKIIEGVSYFECLHAEYLTPKFNKLNPNEIVSVTEQYKMQGSDLKDQGFTGLVDQEIYWCKRTWDLVEEICYVPWKVSDTKAVPEISTKIKHDMGYVPVIWVKNLPGHANGIDGRCTFQHAIDTNIELDYQLSQCGRGLKYSSEPLLMIKNPMGGLSGEITLGGGNVISVNEDGDVKHVEIDGKAAGAVMEYAKHLRDIALENIHGNRMNPDKMHTIQSGKAMQMMHLPLVWLADKLRVSYGEGALRQIVKMFLTANQKTELQVGGQRIAKGSLDPKQKITLEWPDWFPSTGDDRLKDANSLHLLKDSGLISVETAIKSLAPVYNIVDNEEEYATIEREMERFKKIMEPTVAETVSA